MKKHIKKFLTSILIFLSIIFIMNFACWFSLKVGGYLSHDIEFAMYVYDEIKGLAMALGLIIGAVFSVCIYIILK